jgi:cytochrome P450|tara:strand:+ start:2436 stop:2873 length:438 start_codon:yes stop_codon:yes gene_type:complete
VLQGGITVDNRYFQAGTVVGVPMYAIHHHLDYFPSPFTFQPGRWIESPCNPASSIALARKAFNPFSIGTRQCSGRNLAYLQLKLTLAHFLWRFDLRESEEGKGRGGGGEAMGVGRERVDEFQMWDALGFGRDGPMVEVRLREIVA